MIVMVMVPGGKLITTVMSMITNGKREESEDHGTWPGAGTTPKGSLRTPHPVPRIGNSSARSFPWLPQHCHLGQVTVPQVTVPQMNLGSRVTGGPLPSCDPGAWVPVLGISGTQASRLGMGAST